MSFQIQFDTTFQDFLNIAQDFVYQAGAVSLQHLQALFPKFKVVDLERIITTRLVKTKQCQRIGEYFCPLGTTDMANIMTGRSLWVAMDIMDYDVNNFPLFSRTPHNSYMVIKNDKVYEIVYMHRNNISSQITMLNERYNRIHADNQNNAIVYVIVIEEDTMLDTLDEYKLHFPYMVAYVSNNIIDNRPEILTTDIATE